MRLPRVRLAFSVRSLLLLTLVFGLWMGWRANKAARQREAVAEVKKYNGYVRYDYEYANGKELPDAKPKAPAWLRRLCGDEYFQEVTRVKYVDQPISDATLAPLKNLTGIEELCFVHELFHPRRPVQPPPGQDGLSEAGLSRLEGLTRLRKFVLDDGKRSVSGSMLNRLNLSRDLEEIRLEDVGLTDQGMPSLKSMPHLRELDLSFNGLTGTFLASIRGSKSLEVLTLRSNPLSPVGLGNIGSLTKLRELDLSNTDVDDAGMSRLAGLTNLRKLTLRSTKVTDAGLASLAGMKRLETLFLENCNINGRGFDALRSLTGLYVLGLSGSHVDDAGLAALGTMTQLEDLELYHTQITDAGLVHLRGLKRLKTLSLAFTKVTDAETDRLKSELPMLGTVDQ